MLPISKLTSTMPHNFLKGSAVEVSSEEPGFEGAWYVATLLDQVNSSPTKKKSKTQNVKGKIGYLVKYDTLVKEDNVHEQLTEVVAPSLVRPLPPRNVRRNEDNNNNNAKEAELVDESGGFEVYDVVDAYHRDGWWVGVVKSVVFDTEGGLNKYVVLFENPREEFEFEKSNLRFHVDWVDCCWMVPPKKMPDEELGFTTPAKQTLITDVTVGSQLSATRSSLRKRSEDNSAVVTYSRNKRNGNLVQGDSLGKRLRSSGGKGNTKAIVSVLETSGSDDVHQDSSGVEHAIMITENCEAEDGKSHKTRKRGRPPKLAVNKPIGLLEGNIDEAPLSVWFQGMHPLSVLKRSSRFSPPVNSTNQAITVTSGGGSTDYQQDWPFTKRAPIWDTIESLELYQTPPQKPHFSPLKKKKEDYREGLAIAHMVTFGNIVQRLSRLQLNDPVDIIQTSLETLCELETNGFDVGSIRARLNELLLLKSKVGPYEDKRKEVEDEIEKCNNEKSRVEKQVDRLKAKMQALKEKTEQGVAMQKAKEEEIVKLQTNLDLVANQINDWELAFEKLCKKDLI